MDKKEVTHIVGIDEAGRGPLAGPVAIGLIAVPVSFAWERIPGVNDSKQLSEKKRMHVFRCASLLKNEGKIKSSVALIDADYIDTFGIVSAIEQGIENVCHDSNLEPMKTVVLLDGGIRAPLRFPYQRTIIRGDQSEKVIGLASIFAKVTRDAFMVEADYSFPEYGFKTHKGYGTKAHSLAIERFGLSPLHRRSFCTRFSSLSA